MDRESVAKLRAERRLLQRAIVAIERYQQARGERERCEEVLPALLAANCGGALSAPAAARLRLIRGAGGERSSCGRFLGRGRMSLMEPLGDGGPDPPNQT